MMSQSVCIDLTSDVEAVPIQSPVYSLDEELELEQGEPDEVSALDLKIIEHLNRYVLDNFDQDMQLRLQGLITNVVEAATDSVLSPLKDTQNVMVTLEIHTLFSHWG